MKAKKRNGFWTFCFSFVPGCAEMYWGFMQAGMSLLIPFMGLIFIAYLLNMSAFLFLDLIVYIYAFFHARNMAHLTEEEVSGMHDGRVNLLEGQGVSLGMIQKHHLAKWGGIALIVFGIYQIAEVIFHSIPFSHLINLYYRMALHSFPQAVTAVLLIVLGVKLIAGKKQAIDREIEGGGARDEQ